MMAGLPPVINRCRVSAPPSESAIVEARLLFSCGRSTPRAVPAATPPLEQAAFMSCPCVPLRPHASSFAAARRHEARRRCATRPQRAQVVLCASSPTPNATNPFLAAEARQRVDCSSTTSTFTRTLRALHAQHERLQGIPDTDRVAILVRTTLLPGRALELCAAHTLCA
jgi:hypothetical protein